MNMKITASVRLPYELWDRVKRTSKEHRYLITDFVESALAAHIAAIEKPAAKRGKTIRKGERV